MTPLEQLITFLVNIDGKLANINKDKFLQNMINLAKEEAILLHLHQGEAAECGQDESYESSKDVDREKEKKSINDGVFYDIRIKAHVVQDEQQVIFVFTNVSAEKDLQRELVMK